MAVIIANELADEVAFSGLVTTRLEGGLKNTLAKKVEYTFLNKKKAVDFFALFRLREFVKKNKVNTIHAHSSSYFFAVLLKISYQYNCEFPLYPNAASPSLKLFKLLLLCQ